MNGELYRPEPDEEEVQEILQTGVDGMTVSGDVIPIDPLEGVVGHELSPDDLADYLEQREPIELIYRKILSDIEESKARYHSRIAKVHHMGSWVSLPKFFKALQRDPGARGLTHEQLLEVQRMVEAQGYAVGDAVHIPLTSTEIGSRALGASRAQIDDATSKYVESKPLPPSWNGRLPYKDD